jgi:hypothetical protein
MRRPVDAPAGLQQRREERALPQLGDLELHIAGLGRQQPGASPVAVGRGGLGALIGLGADVLSGLGVDQGLQHQRHALANDIQLARWRQTRLAGVHLSMEYNHAIRRNPYGLVFGVVI